jgi:Domain of Unknown Function (DUF1080)
MNFRLKPSNTTASGLASTLVLCLVLSCVHAGPMDNTLSAEEQKGGWLLLFNGSSTAGWHTFKNPGVDSRWHVAGGELTLEPSATGKGSGADLQSDRVFKNFELRIDWKISPGGNSGIYYRSTAEFGVSHPWESGPEYQLLDNLGYSEPPAHQSGAVWDFYPPVHDVTRTVGLFNHTYILVRGAHVEHWMNGVQLLAYELGSKDFNAKLAQSAFHTWLHFGAAESGAVGLQDEGRLVAFKNIMIRPIK